MKVRSDSLRVTALEIRNLWGVAEAIVRPGKRNIIRGPNGTGKTSLLEAIQIALGGGTLGKYQRIGADGPPEIVLEISGPTESIRVEREGDKPPRVLKQVGDSAAYEKVKTPASFLKGLFDTKGANPFIFLGASDDDRAQLLLEALDLEMDEELLAETLGSDAELASSIPSNMHPLIRLSLTHDAIYTARRGCNVEAEGKFKAAEQLKRSIPAERATDLKEDISSLDAQTLSSAEELAKTTEANNGMFKAAIAAANEESQREIKAVRVQCRSRAETLNAELDVWISTAKADLEKQIADKKSARDDLLLSDEKETSAITNGILATEKQSAARATEERERRRQEEEDKKAEIADDRETLAKAREQQAESERHENTRGQIKQFEAQADSHKEESKRLTEVIKGLKELKRTLAEKLPIPGLDISGKEIKVNDVPWRSLNKAQRGSIAGIVAVERAKKSKLPIVFFDEAEQFDAEHLETIADIVNNAGVQLFAAVVVKDGEIEIEADGELTGSVLVGAPLDPTVRAAKKAGD